MRRTGMPARAFGGKNWAAEHVNAADRKRRREESVAIEVAKGDWNRQRFGDLQLQGTAQSHERLGSALDARRIIYCSCSDRGIRMNYRCFQPNGCNCKSALL